MNANCKTMVVSVLAGAMLIFVATPATAQVYYDGWVQTPVYGETYTVYHPTYPSVQPYYYSTGYWPTYSYRPAYTYVSPSYPRYYYYQPYRNTLRIGRWR